MNGTEKLNKHFAYSHLSNPEAKEIAKNVAAYLIGLDLLDGYAERSDLRSLAAAHEAGHAVILASFGVPLQEARIFKDKHTWGGYVLSVDDCRGIGEAICVAAGGHMGERLTGAPSTFLGGHELGLILYLCLNLEANKSFNALSTLRAALADCEQRLIKNADQWTALKMHLETHEAADAGQLREILKGVCAIGVGRWVGGDLSANERTYPDIERCLSVAYRIAGGSVFLKRITASLAA